MHGNLVNGDDIGMMQFHNFVTQWLFIHRQTLVSLQGGNIISLLTMRDDRRLGLDGTQKAQAQQDAIRRSIRRDNLQRIHKTRFRKAADFRRTEIK